MRLDFTKCSKLLPCLCIALLTLGFHPTRAADNNTETVREHMTKHFWSQIYPNLNYLNGCLTGYRAFVFSPNGYFIFNQRIHGNWRIDWQGNLVLKTQNGQNFRLYRGGPDTLRPANSTRIVSFLARNQVFKECKD